MMQLKDMSFFQLFPSQLVDKLQSAAKVLKVKKGDVILKQGEVNENLYFLLSGQLRVDVDGGLVADLTTKGDLIGEMSLITNQKSTATISAAADSQLLKISGVDLHRLAENEKEGSAYNLYKIYSDILAQKLKLTNDRAKKIEAFVKELEIAQVKLEAVNASLEIKVQERTKKIAQSMEEMKQKNMELQTAFDKLADLYQSRDITFLSLDELLSKNLFPLRERIKQMRQAASGDESMLDKVEKQVVRAIHRLEPLTNSFKAEKQMSSKKVLLGEPIRKQHSVAKLALGGTGVELSIVDNLEEAKQKLKQEKFDIFMFSEDFLEIVDEAKNAHPDMRFVFVTSKDVPQYVPTLLAQSFVPNVVFRDEEDKQYTIKNFVTTVSKLASSNFFGLEKYISWGVEVKQVEVEGSEQRASIVEEMDQYFANSGVRSSRRSHLSLVAEELLMNAIYDAPVENGKPLYNHKSRTEAIHLKESHRPLFRYATDGNTLALSVEDPFGALDAQTLFRYLEKCYSGTGSLNDGRTDKGGGGRGLHQIIENSNLVVFNIDPGRRTEVIALFNTDHKNVSRNPNLHFFKAQ